MTTDYSRYQTSPSHAKLTGFYRGIVVKHERLGRCKIFIKGLYPDDWCQPTKIDKIPSAEQIAPIFGGSSVGEGVFSYPAIGSVVVCGFWTGDQNKPYYFGTVLGGTGAKSAYTHGSRANPTDTTVKDGTDVIAHSINVHNAEINIYEKGQITVKTKTSDTSDFCQIGIDPTGNVVVNTTGSIQFNCKSFKVDATSKIELAAPIIELDALRTNGEIISKAANTKHQSSLTYSIIAPSIDLDAIPGTNGAGTVIATGASRRPMPLAR